MSGEGADPNGAAQLQDEQRRRLLTAQQDFMLAENRERGLKFAKHKDEYTRLASTLATLADEPQRPALVPLGKKAFMCGRLIHTNEVLVLLGENWFAERSAKQAGEICQRRLKRCHEMLDKLMEERKLLEGWKKESEKIEEGVEIREEYEEEMEKKWREKHKESVRKEKQSRVKDDEDNQALWDRLDELELEEELNEYEETGSNEGEKDLSDSSELGDEEPSKIDVDEIAKLSAVKERRRVSFADAADISYGVPVPGDVDLDTIAEIPGEPLHLIEIRHGALPTVESAASSLKPPGFTALTPSDLSVQSVTRVTKSILKPFDPAEIQVKEPDMDEEVVVPRQHRPLVREITCGGGNTAVKDLVVEREPFQNLPIPPPVNAPKRQSRFKLSRLAKE